MTFSIVWLACEFDNDPINFMCNIDLCVSFWFYFILDRGEGGIAALVGIMAISVIKAAFGQTLLAL